MELEDWNREAERYNLTEICPDITVFALKPGMENGEPPHKLCTACFGKRQKGYLQHSTVDGRGTHYKCNICDKEILDRLQKRPPQSVNFNGVFQR